MAYKKSISPIISVVLLILVTTILIAGFMSWSKTSTRDRLDVAGDQLKVASDMECMRAEYFVSSCNINHDTGNITILFENRSKLELRDLTLTVQGTSQISSETLKIYGKFITPVLSGEIKNLTTDSDFTYIINDVNVSEGKLIDTDEIEVFTLMSATCPSKVINLKSCTIDFDSIEPPSTTEYTLTLSKTGSGTGTVTSSPSGIDCGSTCSYDFEDSTSVTLTANATSGNTFTGWSGEGCSGTGTCVVTMTENKSVTATFDIPPSLPPCDTGSDGQGNYILCFADDFDYVRSNLDQNYILGRDIDFFNSDHWNTPPLNISTTTDNWNDGNGFNPIGYPTSEFIGTFDGNNNTLTNLYINRPSTDYVGLFGSVNVIGSGSCSYDPETSKLIQNVVLEDVNITGNDFTAGFIGALSCDYNISNIQLSGTISGSGDLGGVIGYGDGSYSSSIKDSSFVGSVLGSNWGVGGLMGTCSNFNVYNSFSKGDVTSETSVGGLVGDFYYCESYDSYSHSNVSGEISVGGLIGSNAGVIVHNYSIGSVSGTFEVGGLIGAYDDMVAYVENSYWDVNTSGQSSSAGGTPKTTIELKQQSTFTGWDFTNIWNIQEGNSYPFLRWE